MKHTQAAEISDNFESTFADKRPIPETLELIWLKTVSYTHLDVYKRQRLCCSEWHSWTVDGYICECGIRSPRLCSLNA